MDKNFFCNGLNGATGKYLFPDLTFNQASQAARGGKLPSAHLADLRNKKKLGQQEKAVVKGKDPTSLAEVGWGVIFANNYKDESGLTQDAIKDALSSLLEYRRTQATQENKKYYQEYIYHSGDSKEKFLSRYNIASGIGLADPDNMPYYLLIVGDPETIPFSLQYQLDVVYAVGRVYFDTLEEYARYADSVLASEKGQNSQSRRACFFGVRNNDDLATQSSAEYLVQPLAEKLKEKQSDWTIETILAREAKKSKLSQLLGGSETPSFLFTASHGVSFPKDHELHLKHQGALVCQDWPGPMDWDEDHIPHKHYFAAEDVADDAQLNGLITFHFACFGLGTPKRNNFYRQTSSEGQELAVRDLISPLPKRLLSHSRGGALAVIGHVDRAWTRSFQSNRELQRLAVFRSTFQSIMQGEPVGLAMEYFNQRYAECATELHQYLEKMEENEVEANDEVMADLWLDINDARNYAIFGDPAVRLVASNKLLVGNKPSAQENITLPASKTSSLGVVNSEQRQDAPALTSNLENILDNSTAPTTVLTQRVENLERQVKILQEQNELLKRQLEHLQQSAT
jgi:hypothetical protein